MSADDAGSEDVADFLARIKELGDKRQREDEERTRKLEEEILQGRKEREARRAERARSISPTKDSPLNSSSASNPRPSDSPLALSTRAGSIDRDSIDLEPGRRQTTPMAEPVKPNPPPSSAGPARSGTLSWQQRPGSRGSPTVRSRPLSNIASDAAARPPSATSNRSSVEPDRMSMSQRAQALEGKDPSYFRQTADRGANSAAYRKNEESPSLRSDNVRLPGISREQSLEADNASDTTGLGQRSQSPAYGSSIDTAGVAPRGTASSTHSSFASPPPLLPARGSDSGAGGANSPSRSPAMSPAQGRISPDKDRPISPTKGLGGFVQSAMMKRSDSVSKRLSAQPGAGLTRGDSVSRRNAKPSEAVEGSPTKDDDFVKPALPNRSSIPERDEAQSESQRPETPMSGHARTDSKRWSPTKSSWLEAAINKTEPPKPKPAVSQQPSWMVDLNKAKQSRGSVDLGKATAHKEVSVGGFLRSPPMGGPSKPPAVPTSTKPITPDSMASVFASEEESPKSLEEQTGDAKSGPSDLTESKLKPSGSLKQKPETPPKKDFRSSLKSRPPPSTAGKDNPAEFKDVFGKLKKTETKNYVAENVFKNNILRGKADLNITGGPRPWQKKDEFKDSILAKKKEMREGTSVVNTGKVNEANEAVVPEGLSKRQNMSKPVVQAAPASKEIPEALSKRQNMTARPGSITSRTSQSSIVSDSTTKASGTPVTEALFSDPQLKDESRSEQRSDSGRPADEPPSETQADSPRPTRPNLGASSSSSSSSKLADRFNPALAGILARGPPGGGAASPSRDGSSSKSSEEPKQASAPLTHTTKDRARGPKRRAPKKDTADSRTESPANQKEEHSVVEEPAVSGNKISKIQEPEEPAESEAPPMKPKPYANSGSDGMRSIAASVATTAKLRSTGQDSTSLPARSTPATKLNTSVASKPLPGNNISTGSPASGRSQTSSPELKKKTVPEKPAQASSPKSPPQPGMKPESLARASSKPGSPELTRTTSATSEPKINSPSKPSVPKPSFSSSDADPPKPVSPDRMRSSMIATQKPVTPAKPVTKSTSVANNAKVQPENPSTAGVSKTHQTLSEFFSLPLQSVADNKANVDTQAILLKSPASEKIKTLRKEIWEVTGDGKKISMPSDQSHVLFENSMFLCSHIFGAASGKRTTEVYLWCGHGVSPSAIEDAQLFCRNAARDAGGKLIIVEQGKEPSNFFEALGGIVITRIGSPATAHGARYMLCGRRHMGHIAFDEVSFTPKALCSGFPHIVAAADGSRVYLWKGKGSSTDELGCARLIAMDIGLSGDIEEVDEGAEPAGFWKAFASADKPETNPTQWAKKATCEKYGTRLFAVDVDARPKSSGSGFMQWARRGSTPAPEEASEHVREISPFTQSDITAEGVFVLDTFFEMFVIVGANASQRLSSLHAALIFAQEYGVLATSMEDRPFIPAGKVVLGGSTEGMKTAFRRWRDNQCATAKGDSVIGLNEALEAFEEGR